MEIQGNENIVSFAIILLTLFLPVLVGLIAMRRTKNESDFCIGGRSMNKFVVALSAVSSGRSGWLVLAVSGMAYTMGVGAVWAVVGYIVVEMFQFVFIGRRLRSYTEKHNCLTLLDYFESKFNDKSRMLRITGAIIILIFITSYVAAQFNAGAKSLSTALNWSIPLSLAVSGILVLIYMILGGFIAVAYNDVVRALIMIAGLVIFPIIGLIKVGGLNPLLTTLQALDPKYVNPTSLGLGAIIGFMGIGLGSPGQPHIVVRYMSIQNPDQLRHSMVIGTFWNVVMAWGAVLIGLLGRHLIPAIESLPNQDPETIYLLLSSQYIQTIHIFGPVLYGLLLGGIFAAILSTADSQLLVAASTFTHDIYNKLIKTSQKRFLIVLIAINILVQIIIHIQHVGFKLSPFPLFTVDALVFIFKTLLSIIGRTLLLFIALSVIPDILSRKIKQKEITLCRYGVIVFGITAIFLAYYLKDLIFWFVLFAWGGLGASFGTSVIFSLYWKRTHKFGILAGMLAGTVITIIWKLYLKASTGLYELIPAFFGSALVIVLVSLFLKNQAETDKSS